MKSRTRSIHIPVLISLLIVASALLIGDHTPRASLAATAACIPGPHSGTITTDQSWCVADNPHLVTGTVTVAPGVTLTIEPGVIVKVRSDPWYIKMIVQGNLVAAGTSASGITFTHESSYTWAGIVVDGGSATLAHATVEWACGNDVQPQSNVAVLNGGQLEMTDSTLRECHYGGGAGERMFFVGDGTASVANSTFTTSDEYAIYITGLNSHVTLTDNIIDGNYYDRILLSSNAMMGHDVTLTPQAVWDGYDLEATYTVPVGVTLTLEPGVTMKATRGTALVVQGKLLARGTETAPILFTTGSLASYFDWGGILVVGGSAQIAYTTVENAISSAQTIISVSNGGYLELTDSLLQGYLNFDSTLLHISDATVRAASTTFTGATTNNILVTGDSTVLIVDSVIESSVINGIVVEGDQAFVRVTNSRILSNGVTGGDGVRNTGNATVILGGDPELGNFIAFNQNYGANQTGLTGQIIATYNFWGDPSGPTHSGNPGGIGEEVSDRVLYEPWLTEAPSGTLPDEMVHAFGPNYASPGETLYLGYLLHNITTGTLIDTILVGQLPEEVEYHFSSPEGEYWPARHQVVWHLGDLAPGEAAFRAVQVRYTWGLERHLMTYSGSLAVAENLPNTLLDLDEYLAYEQVTVTSSEELSEQELDDLLAADPELNALYEDSVSQGFAYYGAALLQQLSDGREQVSLPMIDITASGETVYLTQLESSPQRLIEFPQALQGTSSTVSFAYDYSTWTLDAWEPVSASFELSTIFTNGLDAALSCSDFGLDDCMRNCLINNLPLHQFDEGQTANCRACYTSGDHCSLCAFDLSFFHGPEVELVVDTCSNQCSDVRDLWKCEDSTRQCVTSHTILVTPCVDCEYDTSQNYTEACPADTRCVLGSCEPIHYPETHPVEILTAGDPNEMVGPEIIVPNQAISYNISYENVGEGTAYGVYVESRLPDLFDPGTLQLSEGGLYIASSRTLFWLVGELAPGAGGSASFEVLVPASALSGTVVVASATVYFPSVPETTPTGDVVSLVANVVAYSQQVTTTEGAPVPVILTGYTPTGNPLTFQVLDDCVWGELSGTAPNLTYTPAVGFEGVDYFTFQVNDGLNISPPATVMLVVQTGSESVRPEVLYTSPAPGATEVHILGTSLDTGTYMPVIIAWFSEPLDPATVTTNTVHLTAAGGQDVAGVAIFVAGTNRVEFRPSQPLRSGTYYTATITTGVRDTSGNALAASYQWSFITQAGQGIIFLPIIQK